MAGRVGKYKLSIQIVTEGSLREKHLMDPDVIEIVESFIREYTGKKFEVVKLLIEEKNG